MKYLILFLAVGCMSPRYSSDQCFASKTDESIRKIIKVREYVYDYKVDKIETVYTMRHMPFEKMNFPVECPK